MAVVVVLDGQTFKRHKDVLSIWSPYFAALFRGPWADREHVDFTGNISATTLEVVMQFVYTGVFEKWEIQGDIETLEDILEATDYFGMNYLEEQVSGVLALRGKIEHHNKKGMPNEDSERTDIQGICLF
ncbi:BTB/POZ domain-containing protein [Aspergillus lucknowensis]|uniref:BTB domain-containing protein n=1 Tax=Aspergillus lucknowensis TaxID=176173 RepID=A0ABR4LL98_9EURO